MRYKYTITEEDKEPVDVQAMSYKKMLKSLLLRIPKFTGWITYINKKNHEQVKGFINGKQNKSV
tara:strand:- start:21 stop:212 length:192 start_codon:yes stop_codon:yes gene_type:complete